MPRTAPAAERIVYAPVPGLPGSDFLIVENSLQRWHMFHERYAICACRSAAAGWRYAGRQHFSVDYGMMLLEPGETHRNTWVHKPSDFRVLMLPAETLGDAGREMGLRQRPHFPNAQVDGLRSLLFEATYRLAGSVESCAGALEQQSHFAAFAGLLLQQAERRPPELMVSNAAPAIERVRRHLYERFDQSVSLDELAVLARLSRFHLVHTFTRQLGLPPHAYQNHIRCERARTLLRRGVAAADVAAQVGFADQSHLTRHFKRMWRVTPSAYSRMVSGAATLRPSASLQTGLRKPD